MQIILGRGPTHRSNRVSEVPVTVDFFLPPEFAEWGNRDLIGHLIKFNVIQPVKAAMATQLPVKRARPYLD